MVQWDKVGRLSLTDSIQRTQKIAALTASGDLNAKVSIGDLTNRIAMLGDVRGRVFLIKRDLATLVLSIQSGTQWEKTDRVQVKKK